jgi:hypothetical protein
MCLPFLILRTLNEYFFIATSSRMKYGEALKIYYGKLGKKVEFPKKGSAEHSAIRALMSSGDIAPNAGSAVSADAAVATKVVKPKKARKAKDAPTATKPAETPAKLGGTTLIDTPHVSKQAIEKVEDDAAKPAPKKRRPRAVQSNGLSPQQNLEKKLTEENAHMMVAPAAYPGLKEQLAKVLDKVPEGIPTKRERKPRVSKTLEHNRAPDMAAIEGAAPFSFAAIRRILRQ